MYILYNAFTHTICLLFPVSALFQVPDDPFIKPMADIPIYYLRMNEVKWDGAIL